MLPEVRVAQIFSGDVTKQTAVPNPRVWNFLILGLFCLGRMPSNVIPYYVPSSDPPQTNSNFWRMCCGSCRELAMLQVTWSRLQVTLTPGQPLSHCSCVWRPVPKGSLGQGTEAVRQSTILLSSPRIPHQDNAASLGGQPRGVPRCWHQQNARPWFAVPSRGLTSKGFAAGVGVKRTRGSSGLSGLRS